MNRPGPSPARRPLLAAGLVAAAIGVVVFVRLRAGWPAYRSLHGWLNGVGVPDAVRGLDYPLIMLGAVFFGAMAVCRVTGIRWRETVLTRWPERGWIGVVVTGSLPVVAGGVALMIARGVQPGLNDLIFGVVRAPLIEEVFFRGLLVAGAVTMFNGVPLRPGQGERAGSSGFWGFAVVGALVFGFIHVTWTAEGLATGWPNVLVTGAGGVWYAWLMRAWRSVLVPMVLHGTTNLCWLLAMPEGGGAAGGGLIENVLRAGSIGLATWLTIRVLRGREQHTQ